MNIVVIGAQWGDEGKAKTVDYLAEDADVVTRYSGGANAGHTIVVDGKTYKLHLIPSGIVYPGKKVVLGVGMVIDPQQLFQELDNLAEQGLNTDGRIFISDRAHLVLPQYKKMDVEMEAKRIRPIGTTGRGIGIAYAQKAQRDGIRVVDMYEKKLWNELPSETREFLAPYRDKMKPMVVNLSEFAHQNKEKDTLVEGAQGALLDLDIGTYPFVSSGMSSSSGAAVGAGMGPRHIDKVLGVFKAYVTRVGNGPFPTEFNKERDGNMDELVRELGHEYGVTTGRARRCGFLDLVALRYTCWTNSIDSLVMTHIDIYDTMDEIKVCTGYKINGEVTNVFPASPEILEEVEPVIEVFPGWHTPLTEIKSYDQLPKNAVKYIEFIEKFIETPIDIVSVGAERGQTIERKGGWTK